MQFIYFLFGIFVFIFGICIGSFLNVVIYRLEKKESLKGRSFCPSCNHKLSWQDLFPVLSFLFLLGKCRYCHKKISLQYPIIEISSALIFLLIFSAQGGPASGWNFLNSFFLFYIASALIVIFVYDLKHYIIPDKILFPAIGVAFVYRFLEFASLGGYLLAAAIGSGFFLVIFLISKGAAMGFGDVKLAVLMGLLLGFPNILAGLFFAFFFGAVIGTALMILKRKGLKSEIPFGPFLIFGTFVAMFWGQKIIYWYLNLSA
ncbi:MAG: prepilin peptidase [Candidatus Staskawiczbacteria bacterium]|nr:prepilin peptidase [Candidatus Staskawiczbacteria bacterium]